METAAEIGTYWYLIAIIVALAGLDLWLGALLKKCGRLLSEQTAMMQEQNDLIERQQRLIAEQQAMMMDGSSMRPVTPSSLREMPPEQRAHMKMALVSMLDTIKAMEH